MGKFCGRDFCGIIELDISVANVLENFVVRGFLWYLIFTRKYVNINFILKVPFIVLRNLDT